MCLSVVAFKCLENWPLVVVANRDEFHARLAAPLAPWSDLGQIVAGRDLTGGGTWLGMSVSGRFALLTNYREPGKVIPDAPTRGGLTERFLLSDVATDRYASDLQSEMHRYNGFNLLIGDSHELWYVSNRSQLSPHKLGSGVFGMSNAELQTPWPKLVKTREAVAAHLQSVGASNGQPDSEILFDVMYDGETPPDHQLPTTGVGIERERMLGSPFIKSPSYGTRCTTVVMVRRDGVAFIHEKTFNPDGEVSGRASWCLDTALKQAVAA